MKWLDADVIIKMRKDEIEYVIDSEQNLISFQLKDSDTFFKAYVWDFTIYDDSISFHINKICKIDKEKFLNEHLKCIHTTEKQVKYFNRILSKIPDEATFKLLPRIRNLIYKTIQESSLISFDKEDLTVSLASGPVQTLEIHIDNPKWEYFYEIFIRRIGIHNEYIFLDRKTSNATLILDLDKCYCKFY